MRASSGSRPSSASAGGLSEDDHPPAEAKGHFVKQTGGHGQYGDVWIELEPLPRREGFEFVDKIVGGVIPRSSSRRWRRGSSRPWPKASLPATPLVDVRATLVDGSYHDVDSSEMAFKMPGPWRSRTAARKDSPQLLEPIMP